MADEKREQRGIRLTDTTWARIVAEADRRSDEGPRVSASGLAEYMLEQSIAAMELARVKVTP